MVKSVEDIVAVGGWWVCDTGEWMDRWMVFELFGGAGWTRSRMLVANGIPGLWTRSQ